MSDLHRAPLWDVQLNKEIRKRLARHGKEVNRRLQKALERLRTDPQRGKPLKCYRGVFSYRVGTPSGEFRVIYRLKRKEHVILVDLIEPREEVYKILGRMDLE
jgi:mRNA-degrading endonuclease RelE of RelBE toxin-antitoxin system